MFDEIICRACSVHCHKGHTIVPHPTQMCRCAHKTCKTISSAPEPLEMKSTEKLPLLPQHISSSNMPSYHHALSTFLTSMELLPFQPTSNKPNNEETNIDLSKTVSFVLKIQSSQFCKAQLKNKEYSSE